MSGQRRDPDPEHAPEADSTPSKGGQPPGPPSDEAGRRSFLLQLSGDAISTAGRLAGASGVIRRSMRAAGEMAIRELDRDGDARSKPPDVADDAPRGGPTAEPSVPAGPTDVAPSPSPAPQPDIALSPEQHAFLTNGTKAVLAVNDPTGPPLLTSSIYLWDEAVIRLPAREFTARAVDIDRDPRVCVLIDEPSSEAWVAVTGVASLVYGDQVDREMLMILRKYHPEDDATRLWEEMRSSGDRIAILIRPTRFVWRPG